MSSVLLALAVGVVVGFVVGALGGGGGVLTVPALVYLLGQDPHAAATSSLVIVGLTSVTALVPHARGGNVRWRDGLVFAALAVVATVGGTALSLRVDGTVLMGAFAVLLLAVSALMIRKARGSGANGAAAVRSPRGSGANGDAARSPRRPPRRRVLPVAAWASVVGLLTGFFGVGGGFALVPALALALAFPMREAVGTSLLVLVVNSAVGLATRLGSGVEIDWPLVLTFAVASMLAGQAGAVVSRRARPATLTLAFGILLALVAVGTGLQVTLGD